MKELDMEDLKAIVKHYQSELKSTLVAIDKVKEQIAIYNKKGQELSAFANFLNGKIEAITDLIKNREDKKDE